MSLQPEAEEGRAVLHRLPRQVEGIVPRSLAEGATRGGESGGTTCRPRLRSRAAVWVRSDGHLLPGDLAQGLATPGQLALRLAERQLGQVWMADGVRPDLDVAASSRSSSSLRIRAHGSIC
jgi:hypothetical protein